MTLSKAQLRSTLHKLRQLPLDHSDATNVRMVPQEMLDFLAMLVGLKPVYLGGRGFDDGVWIDGLMALSQQMRAIKLRVLEGPGSHAQPRHLGLPQWYGELRDASEPSENVYYICRSPLCQPH